MPLENPVEISGAIRGAYVDEGFDVGGERYSLLQLLQYIFTELNGGVPPTANNGLNVDGGVIQMGGPLIEDTTVTNTDKTFKLGKETANNASLFLQDSLNKFLSIQQETANDLGYMAISPTGWGINIRDKETEIATGIELGNDFGDFTVSNLDTAEILAGLTIKENQTSLFGLRSYANTAAAQADGTFEVGGLYTIVSDPSVVRIKHT